MPTIQRILFPTDFSPNSRNAHSYVQNLVEELDAELYLLFVAEGHSLIAPDSTSLFSTPAVTLEEVCRSAMPHLRSLLGDKWHTHHNVSCTTRIGKPYREIIKYAKEVDIDLIIMGTHGHTGALSILVGSVAENVVRHSHCPVMTVRSHDRS